MFLTCAAAILMQMLITGNLSLVIGETVILVTGGIIYIFSSIKSGCWIGVIIKSTHHGYFIISIVCTVFCILLFYLILAKRITLPKLAAITAGFFVALSAISYAVLRGISHLSRKKADR